MEGRGEMDVIQTILNLVLLLSVLAMAQVFGGLVYVRLRQHHFSLAHISGFLLTTFSFFAFASLFWVYLPAKANRDEKCGLPILGAGTIVLVGTLISVIFNLIIQSALRHSYQVTAKVQ